MQLKWHDNRINRLAHRDGRRWTGYSFPMPTLTVRWLAIAAWMGMAPIAVRMHWAQIGLRHFDGHQENIGSFPLAHNRRFLFTCSR